MEYDIRKDMRICILEKEIQMPKVQKYRSKCQKCKIQIKGILYQRVIKWNKDQTSQNDIRLWINDMRYEIILQKQYKVGLKGPIISKIGVKQLLMKQELQVNKQQKDQQQNYQIISHILPSLICKLLNNAIILINLWWSKTHQILLMGMGVATVFSFTFGYLIIISLNTGLAYEISRKRNKPQKIGIFYQRALIVNFLICAVTITPLLYISKKLVVMFEHIDLETASIISQYLFQLLPSIYCFAFFDTTQTYLQSQGHILAPLIVQIVSVFMHMFLINHIGAAWSKNFTDFFCCIAIYIYIKTLDHPLKSWVEWTMKCIKGWGTHLKFLQVIGLSTYLQTLFFFIFSMSAFKIDHRQLVCHVCFINIMQIIYLAFLGIKVGGLSKIGYKLKQNDFKSTRKQAELTIKIILGTGLVLILIIFFYKEQILQFFIRGQKGRFVFANDYWILILTIALTSIQTAISSLVKALERNFSVLKLNLLSYVIGISAANILCYHYEYGLDGMWFGWNIGVAVNCLCCFYYLNKKYKQFFLQHQRQVRQYMFKQKQSLKRKDKDPKNDDLQNEKYFQMKVLNNPNPNLSKSNSLGIISEAQSAMEGSKPLILTSRQNL